MNLYDSDQALDALNQARLRSQNSFFPGSQKDAGSKPGRVAGMKPSTPQKKPNMLDGALDLTQGVLSIAGFVPGFGAAPDLINAGVSALRGDWAGAGMNALAAIPGFGDAAAVGNIGKKGLDMANMAGKAGKII
jgi:hypothetical protein